MIKDEGVGTERIIVVLDQPAKWDVVKQRPCVGPAGERLSEWLGAAGLFRHSIYWTYVVPDRDDVARRDMHVEDLHAKIANLTDPVVIVPLCNPFEKLDWALQALIGKRGIDKYRGSILPYVDRRGRTMKVIPTFHPACTFRSPSLERRCRYDWIRIAADATFHELNLPERHFLIRPTIADVQNFAAEVDARPDGILAVDIETPREVKLIERKTKTGKLTYKKEYGRSRITCVGFSYDPSHAICVPTTDDYWGNKRDLLEAWGLIRRMCAAPIAKTLQNGLFDSFYLKADHDIDLTNYVYDTMDMSHALDSTEEHSLAYLACVPGDHKVLTPEGWVRFDKLVEGTSIAQWHPDKRITWEPAKIVSYDYRGEMIRLRATHINTLMTPNHRVPLQIGRGWKQMTTAEARSIQVWRQALIPSAGLLQPKTTRTYSDAFLRLCVAIQADGSLSGKRARFTLSKHRKIKRLYELAACAGVNIAEGAPNKQQNARVFRVWGQAVEDIWTLVGKSRRWGAWLLELPLESRLVVLEELLHWDGQRTSKGMGIVYSNVQHINRSWISTLAHISGRRGYDDKGSRVTISASDKICLDTRLAISKESFDGRVYCLNTTSGFFLLRAGGQIQVTGNSTWTRQPYWKSMGKEDDEFGDVSDLQSFWEYNCTDACVQRELTDLMRNALDEDGKFNLYLNHYPPLRAPLLSLMLGGIRRDPVAATAMLTELRTQLTVLRRRLDALVTEKLEDLGCSTTYCDAKGKPFSIFGPKSISSKKLQTFLYTILKVPKRTKRDKATGDIKLTSDEIALRTLRLKYPIKCAPYIDAALEYRRIDKVQSFLHENVADPDDMVRCSYRRATETHRLASRKNPRRTGQNLQNVDREVRRVYVPDAGTVLVEVDLSQAEDRVVKAYAYAVTGNPDLLARARANSWENDEHKRAASAIFGVPIANVTKEQRKLGKTTRHAVNYDEGGKTMSETLLKEGGVYTPDECQEMIERLHAADPDVRLWQRSIRMEIMRTRQLMNSWGWAINFKYERLNDQLYKQGYAYKPQSDVGILTNMFGLIPTYEYIMDQRRRHRNEKWRRTRIALQVHDALVLCCPPETVYDCLVHMKAFLERPRCYGGVELTIPVEMKIGTSWKMDFEYKQLPSRREVEDAATSLLSKRATA